MAFTIRPDVQIVFAPVAAELANAGAGGVLWQAAQRRFLLSVPDVARYLVTDGAAITIDRAAHASDESVMRFLRLTPLAALHYQRGGLAFHAAAASPPPHSGRMADDKRTGAILIAGDSGVGKSTLLAALVRLGWSLLADDLSVVEAEAGGRIVVLPAFPEIVLWPDAVERLGLSAATRPDMSGPPGRNILTAPLAAEPRPLRAIHWLSVHYKDEIETADLKGAERFRAIGSLTYNSRIADALLDRAAYWGLASVIARSIPLRRWRRPRGRWSADELADRITRASS